MTRKRSHEGTPQSQAQTVSAWDGSLEPELSVLWTTFPFNLACLGEPGASVLQQPALTAGPLVTEPRSGETEPRQCPLASFQPFLEIQENKSLVWTTLMIR